MKNEFSKILLLGALGGTMLTGCVYSHRAAVVAEPTTTGHELVVVHEAPPPARHEIIRRAPDAAHVWVAGYWTYSGHRWVWIPGHWELRPRENAVWVPGTWDKNADGHGWTWTPGHWE